MCYFLAKLTKKPIVVCEHHRRRISCPVNKVIQIKYANYGRLNRRYCPSKHIKTTKCRSLKSMRAVSKVCNGKRSCLLFAKNQVFGDPCYGTYKYLQVSFICKGMYINNYWQIITRVALLFHLCTNHCRFSISILNLFNKK